MRKTDGMYVLEMRDETFGLGKWTSSDTRALFTGIAKEHMRNLEEMNINSLCTYIVKFPPFQLIFSLFLDFVLYMYKKNL